MRNQLSTMVQAVLDGTADPLETYCELKKVLDFGAECLKEIKDAAMIEADKHPDNKFEYKGFTITKVKGRALFKFDHIEDYKNLKDQLKDIESESKAAYQANLKGMLTAKSTGEEIELPKVSYTQDTISIK